MSILLQEVVQQAEGSPIPYLAAAYAAIFLLLFAYMFVLQRQQRRNRSEMQQLQARLDAAQPERSGAQEAERRAIG